MSAIEQVIARARQGEVAFAERKQFKLARSRAIEKLRRFALADPYFYILELVQAAVAGGADYVDIKCSDGDILVSWTGGVIREAELAQLFDFLFASKQRVDLAHVRSLALGVNALLLFAPEQVVIESGDGTAGGTTRMVVRPEAESVEVGRVQGVLNGTYVRARKLDRDKVAKETGRRGGDDGGLEYGTVESRCLAAPVPLVFNGAPLFGWSRQRVPNLFGYREVRSFDEGDLYGSIGRNPTGGEPSFQLLTHGVWVQSYQYELIAGQKLGGVICFDGLRKTIDHSGFVRDERFEEMWLRLRPYAEAVVGGKAAEIERITSVDGLEVSPNELRELLRSNPRVVASASGDIDHKRRARVIARMLDAQVLHVPPSQAGAVRVLGGRELMFWRPQLGDEGDLEFYSQERLAAPAKPHLRTVVELDAPTAKQLAARLAERSEGWAPVLRALASRGALPDEARDGELEAKTRAMLEVVVGATGTIAASLYSPVEPGDAARGLLVRVCSTGRLLVQRLYASAYPGRILDVELPTAQVSLALEHGVAARVAEHFAAIAVPVLRAQDQRALAGLGVGKIEAGSVAARLALEVLARVTSTRLRSARPGRLAGGVSFSLLRSVEGFDPFELPLLRTRAGRALSLRELALLADSCGGLVYGTVPEVPAALDGLDLDRILELDASSERVLIALLGESGYVRIDARDVLCAHRGLAVRDMALGLRDYPVFPLLVEGQGVDAAGVIEVLDAEARQAMVEALVRGLVQRMHGGADEAGAPAAELEEHRRQAVRHLQRFVCRQQATGRGDSLAALGLDRLPLFLDLDGRAWPAPAVFDALASDAGLLVHYGHVLGSAELGALTAAARATPTAAEGGVPSSLVVSAFAYRLLVPLGRVRLAFDFDLDDLEAARNPTTAAVAFLVRERFESAHGSGVLGVPATDLPEYRIALASRGRGVIAAFDELAHRYGVVGMIEVEGERWGVEAAEAIYAELDQRAGELLEALIDELPALTEDPRRFDAAAQVLLHHAGEQLTLIASAVGLTTQVATPLAERILSVPLFDTGALTLVSAQRMIELFRRHFEPAHVAGEPVVPLDWGQLVVGRDVGGSTGAFAFAWLGAHLQPARVVMPASSSGRDAAGPAARAGVDAGSEPTTVPWPRDRELPLDVLAANIEHWLAALRPDQPKVRMTSVRTRVWVVDWELPSGRPFEGGSLRLRVDGRHPLVQRVVAQPSARNLAWLLLAIYAHINETFGPVTNADETTFQVAVGDALVSGRLQLLDRFEAGSDS